MCRLCDGVLFWRSGRGYCTNPLCSLQGKPQHGLKTDVLLRRIATWSAASGLRVACPSFRFLLCEWVPLLVRCDRSANSVVSPTVRNADLMGPLTDSDASPAKRERCDADKPPIW